MSFYFNTFIVRFNIIKNNDGIEHIRVLARAISKIEDNQLLIKLSLIAFKQLDL